MEHFDEIGRFTIPEAAANQLGLYHNNKRLFTIDETAGRLFMRPTNDEPPEYTSVAEMKKRKEELKRKPSGERNIIRRMDSRRDVVIPYLMRTLLQWTQKTCLEITWDDSVISVQEIEKEQVENEFHLLT